MTSQDKLSSVKCFSLRRVLSLLTAHLRKNQIQTPVLSEIQSKILLALLLRGKSSSVEILRAAVKRGSNRNKEKILLNNTGLIEGQIARG
jgi:hypothetical protein